MPGSRKCFRGSAPSRSSACSAARVFIIWRIIALEVRDEMLLKADETSAPEFAAAGATQWTYEGKKGKPVKMPYWSIPDEAYDDPDLMAKWVRLAYEASLRAE